VVRQPMSGAAFLTAAATEEIDSRQR